MRVLHLISSGGMYGAEVMLLNLVRTLTKDNCEVIVAVFHNSRNPQLQIAERLRGEKISVELVPCGGKIDFRAVLKLKRLIRTARIQVVHCHGYKADLYGFLATRFSSVAIVSTAHNWTGKSEVPAIYNRLDRLVLRWFSRIAAVSHGVEQKLRESGVKAEKITWIPNGLDLAPFEARDTSAEKRARLGKDVVVGMVGRLVQAKGCDCFLRAAADVLRHFPNARFMVVGDGPERRNLEQLARDLGIRERVAFLGHCDDMLAVYSSLDYFVLPSFLEAMPMTVLEAMAAKKPVIATTVGEIPQMVEDNVDGLLVPPGDDKALGNAIMRLLQNPALAQKMGANGRNKAQKYFSADVMTRAYLAVYEQVLGGARRPLGATAELF